MANFDETDMALSAYPAQSRGRLLREQVTLSTA